MSAAVHGGILLGFLLLVLGSLLCQRSMEVGAESPSHQGLVVKNGLGEFRTGFGMARRAAGAGSRGKA
eukprot:scaffold1318_cov388-Prasinococcus_capsulatus_cf.AAC.4